MFGSIGGPELFLILVIALIVFGPSKLPEMGRTLGKFLVEFRRASNDFQRTLESEVEAQKRAETPPPPPAPEAPAALPAETAAAPADKPADAPPGSESR